MVHLLQLCLPCVPSMCAGSNAICFHVCLPCAFHVCRVKYKLPPHMHAGLSLRTESQTRLCCQPWRPMGARRCAPCLAPPCLPDPLPRCVHESRGRNVSMCALCLCASAFPMLLCMSCQGVRRKHDVPRILVHIYLCACAFNCVPLDFVHIIVLQWSVQVGEARRSCSFAICSWPPALHQSHPLVLNLL